MSVLQQAEFSANFTNSIVRKRVEAFQLKYSAAAKSLHRIDSMA